MSSIYTAEEIRKWDQFTIENEPISSIDLMERAAVGACKKILGSYSFTSISIICGKGNNGGDGLAMARILFERGFDVLLYILTLNQEGSKDFETNLKRLPSKLSIHELNANSSYNFDTDLIVDCIFGSGLNRPIQEWIGELIQAINESTVQTISIDIPSGLFVGDNSSNDLENVIKAVHTLSFQSHKFPFLFAEYAKYIGRISLIDINLSQKFNSKTLAIMVDKHQTHLKKPDSFGHKGTKGYLSIIAGSDSMLGAALLSARAGFRTGCGYVGVLSPKQIITALVTVLPEAIWIAEDATELPKKTTAIAIGPGLGKTDTSLKKLELSLSTGLPIVIDADALNLLAENRNLIAALPQNAILTPHIGELTRLIGSANSPEELLEKQRQASIEYSVFIIQKGPFSKLTTPSGQIFINTTGNPSMASAGMGDALTGIIGSFLAQGYTAEEAAKNGMYFHGLAGDKAVIKVGNVGLLTSDLIDHIPAALNRI